ncbi:Hypoxic response protein 1 [Roseivivax sp. THAF40]|uniref:CBS domain-containing protein n=1 Tax=unclassified Roseivivax TaxID=2639302 RepID=UPI0012697144|nr:MULTISPECIES: CBS domain-containing protein [unclassified Roseivivax]QFS83156.1 Hypoxic response protein 1 [Roseivivax sp. THAF197b]QFT46900.1 Hypoxic response protein 1 [Roseivivax sp. THAF40]
MQVHQILKQKADDGVVTVAPGTGIDAAAKILSERRIGTLVISRDGSQVEGVLSERDIVRVLGTQGASCMSDTVDDHMTRKIQTCGRNDSAKDVLGRMTEGRFRHMPVVEDGKMVGIITLGDVVKAQLAELEMEKDALEGMIKGF